MSSIIDLYNNTPTLPQIVTVPQYIVFPFASAENHGWQHSIQEWLKALAPLGSVAIGWMMWRVSRNQHDLSKEQLRLAGEQHKLMRSQFDLASSQLEISRKQADTSQQQKEIAKLKLKLDLFEKRYDCYKEFNDIFYFIHWNYFILSYGELDKKHDEMYSKIVEFKLLFSKDVANDIFAIWGMIHKVLKLKLAFENNKITIEEFNEQKMEYSEASINKVQGDLFNKISPFLSTKEFSLV
ncbi:hypothetical protein [Acetobacter pasteurianus]|uniref:hypothetical protein n=1 Tax=Acetobacter pasteurianus TaxID=438 RepID=UPI003D13050C